MGLLTIDDLARRWSLSTAESWELVRVGGVPFVWLGKGEPDLTRRGRKPVRFSLADIERWEQSRRRAWDEPEPQRRRSRVEPVVSIAGVVVGGRLRSGASIRTRRHS